ncbi:hypothetical protein [Microbacterium arborescens]|uniref:hypothetical protein n=1 Tax=Microbacterium arborescens TaxID=33883 RepID=UPI002788D628|nr:hypothetical protein [Microbacterium arborescens]MDQ1215755.1 hypothetical protein [Microbacterium arborescens]
MRSPLEPEVELDVRLSAICGRNQYTRDPAPVIDELLATAQGRANALARTAGIWVGYFESQETAPLSEALRRLPGADAWIAEGQRRRGIPRHSAPLTRP